MAIVRWNPFRDLMSIQQEMNRLFEEYSGGSRGYLPTTSTEGELAYSPWQPAVDIYEDNEAVVLKADLPEIDQKDIDLKVENRTLTLKGHRRLEKEEKKENYHRIERAYGTFQRSFTLPETVDVDKIQAEFKNGVLTVMLPKKPETKAKQISVKTK